MGATTTEPSGTELILELLERAAIELAPARVNHVAAGFVDTPLSAALLGQELENRRDPLRKTLPGATHDVDGGQQFVAA